MMTTTLTTRAAGLGAAHRMADLAPFGDVPAVRYGEGSAALIDALGEAGPVTGVNADARMAAVDAYCDALEGRSLGLRTRLVNIAEWDGPDDLPDDAVIVNAPRPLAGVARWQGKFRSGVFYAAAPAVDGGPNPVEYFGWLLDDAERIVFVTNDDLEAMVAAKLAAHGYASAEDAGMTAGQLAVGFCWPWHEEDK